MRKGDSTQNRRVQLSRRRYAQILAGLGVTGAAGCLGGDDDGNGNGNGGNGNGNGNGNGGNGNGNGGNGNGNGNGGNGNGNGNGEDDDGGENGDDPQRESLRIHINNVPEQANFNPWAATVEAGGELYLSEISSVSDIFTNEKRIDGHTWEATWVDEFDEISIPTMFTDYDIEPPYDVTEYFNEELTYWDGETPIDAEAKVNESWLYHYTDGHHFNDEATFNEEVVDQFTRHWWQAKGEVEGQTPTPRREEILEQDAAGVHAMPPHPEFTTPYVEDFEDIGTEDASDEVTEELASESINYHDLAENEWGGGPYKLDPDRVSQDVAVATLRDDHPNEYATIPEIELQMAETDRQPVMVGEGEIDIGSGIVQESEGDINREMLPDHVQELDRYLQDAGDHFLFNWSNEHLGNLWVRRAIIAAVDWGAVGTNGWGSESSTPSDHHICMTDSVAEATFDEEFLDQLYQYPIEQDMDLAVEWMERSGYTGGPDQGWESPEGEELILTLDVNTDQPAWIGGSETVSEQLQQLGFGIDYTGMDWATWEQRYHHDNVIYDMGVFWTTGGTPWDAYEANGQWWTQPLVGGDPESEFPGDVDYEDYSPVDNHGRPFEQEIPNEVGSIDAPDEAGRQPELEDSELISLPELSEALRNPELGIDFDEATQKLARYANFYVPFYTFHSYTHGTWGNVRDFRFPERGHDAHYTWTEFSSEAYHAKAGIVQQKYDDDYPEP